MTTQRSPPEIEDVEQTSCEHCGEGLDVSTFQTFSEITCPTCEQILIVPGRFNELLVIEEIERKEEASVYVALDKDRKLLQELHIFNFFFEKPHQEKKFLVQAKAACGLDTPHMVRHCAYGVINGFPYVSMELSDGMPMSHYIDPDTPQDELTCLHAMLEISKAMDTAESEQVLHGDLKPDNFLVDDQGITKLTGFIISKFSQSYDHHIQGTPLYIAPEKANREWADFRSDQFSLGASFWHIMGGYPPFSGETAADVVRSRYTSPKPDIRSVAQQVSEETSLFLQRMMESEPRSRFPTFRDLVEELETLISQLEERASNEEHYREELEVEAHELHHNQSKRRVKIVGLVLFIFIMWYFVTQVIF